MRSWLQRIIVGLATIESDSGADTPYGFSIGAPPEFEALVRGLMAPLERMTRSIRGRCGSMSRRWRP